MKNKENWVPTKFVYLNGQLTASRNPKEIRIGSRLIGDLVASYYDKYIKKYVVGNTIDLGCGKVPLYEAYKDYISDNTCVDWGNTLKGKEHLDFKCDLNKALPFRNCKFDTIILSDVLNHIMKPEQLWWEMSRILRKGGRILMNTPFYYCLNESPYDYFRFTEHSLRHFAESTGFQILIIKAIGGTPEILADIFAKHAEYLPIFGKFLSAGIQYIISIFIKTSIGEKISEKTGRVFPFGYFLIAEKK